jgi:hypothetical protein
MSVVDFRQCKYFFLPLNPKCTTTTSSTTIFVPTTTTSTTITTSTTSTTTTVYPPITTTTTTTTTCHCYTGYIVTPDGTKCSKTITTLVTPPTNLQVSVSKTYSQYSNYGSILFNPGYNLNGTTSAGYQVLHTNLWQNIPNDLVSGPMNRCGLWTPTYNNNQDVGFTHCITVGTTKTYYIAVGCDNYAIIRVDGTTIVSQDVSALTTQFGAGASVTFKYWFIYPIQLNAGSHVIEMIGHNISSIAALGTEIYDATSDDIINATDYTTFYNAHIIFSTKDMIGQDIEIGTGGFGWTCPDGYSLIMCNGAPYCTNTSYLNCGATPPITTTTTLLL